MDCIQSINYNDIFPAKYFMLIYDTSQVVNYLDVEPDVAF